MRIYKLTAQRMNQFSESDRQKVYDWCEKEGAPDSNTILSIDLIPKQREVIYHLVTGVTVDSAGQPCFTTLPLSMPIKEKPTWVDLCLMSEA